MEIHLVNYTQILKLIFRYVNKKDTESAYVIQQRNFRSIGC
ncbi:hypothetical protein [Paenibacillus sp. PvR148]